MMASSVFACLIPALVAAGAPGSPPGAVKASSLTAAQAEELVRKVSTTVEEIRGLKFKTPVKMEIIDVAAARQAFRAKIEPWEEAEIRHTQAALAQLGLIPARTELLTKYLDVAEKDLLGYYEPGAATFYLVNRTSSEDARIVMAHELTHALEDQHYSFRAVREKAAGDSDRATAVTAVIEGSAMAVTMAYISRELIDRWAIDKVKEGESRRANRLKSAPSFVQQSLMLPYSLGFTFLLRGSPWRWYLSGGVRFADIDQAYARPPHSTREILHPEQYWAEHRRDAVTTLTLPDLSSVLGEGWSKATEGSVGELGLAVLSGSRPDFDSPEVLLPSRWTNEAASGTVGDVYHHYVNGERRVTVLLTRWESMRDAEQLDLALPDNARLYTCRYGVNLVVVAGDFADKAEALTRTTMTQMNYWPDEPRR